MPNAKSDKTMRMLGRERPKSVSGVGQYFCGHVRGFITLTCITPNDQEDNALDGKADPIAEQNHALNRPIRAGEMNEPGVPGSLAEQILELRRREIEEGQTIVADVVAVICPDLPSRGFVFGIELIWYYVLVLFPLHRRWVARCAFLVLKHRICEDYLGLLVNRMLCYRHGLDTGVIGRHLDLSFRLACDFVEEQRTNEQTSKEHRQGPEESLEIGCVSHRTPSSKDLACDSYENFISWHRLYLESYGPRLKLGHEGGVRLC